MNQKTHYDRGVASRARQLLRSTKDPETREMLKAVIRIFGSRVENTQRLHSAKRRERAAA